MKIQILGAHMTETATARFPCLLVDDILALDAGALSSSLSPEAQQKLKAILLTHYHFDHIKDIPTIAMNFFHWGGTIEVYGTVPVFDALSTTIVGGEIYPQFFQFPPQKPVLKFVPVEPYQTINISGYSVLAIPVYHTVPAVGYQITSPEGKRLFYSGDTGVGLSACWEHTSPDLLITEISMPQMLEKRAKASGHLTPHLLKTELTQFRQVKGYLPHVIAIHLNPFVEREIKAEVEKLAQELEVNITIGKEGMSLHL